MVRLSIYVVVIIIWLWSLWLFIIVRQVILHVETVIYNGGFSLEVEDLFTQVLVAKDEVDVLHDTVEVRSVLWCGLPTHYNASVYIKRF